MIKDIVFWIPNIFLNNEFFAINTENFRNWIYGLYTAFIIYGFVFYIVYKIEDKLNDREPPFYTFIPLIVLGIINLPNAFVIALIIGIVLLIYYCTKYFVNLIKSLKLINKH